ncbi:MAG: glycosyltransferase [Gemmatimonadetes bacterium]|nr:glycosyltransferase [Gemmatimonadota bacterium]
MNRPRLFYVLDSLEEDEVGDQVVTLLGRLPRSRYEPRVVSLGPRGSLGSRIREMQVTLHRLELTGPVGALLAVPKLARLLRGLRCEILHAFQPWAGAVAQLAAPRDARVYRWVRGFPAAPRSVEEHLQAWVERRSVHRPGRMVIASDEGARAAVAARFRLDDVPVVPECVDLGLVRERILRVRTREARIHLGMSEEQRALLCFSDFLDASRMVELLEGFALARTEEPQLRLFIHGRGPEEGPVRWRAEDLRLEDSVVFLGAATQRETALRAAEAVVDAGAWPGWSRGAVEAMALGLPVLRWIPSDDGPDAARYPSVTQGPPDRFARDVLELVRDEPVRTKVARRCAEEAQAYDVGRVVERWAELYGA